MPQLRLQGSASARNAMLSKTMPQMWDKDGERMKVAITSQTKGIDSTIDERFGRCNFFIIVEPESMKCEIISNEANASAGGAGIKAAQELINKKVDAVITGNIGPNAFDMLRQVGIKIFRASGSIKEAIGKFRGGKLEEISVASVSKHGGMR